MAMNFERIFPHASAPGLIQKLYEPIKYNAVIGKKTKYGSRGDDVLYRMKVEEISANSVVGGSSTWRKDIPKNDGVLGQMAIPYYKVQSSFTTNIDEETKFSKLGIGKSIIEFKKAITLQAMAQRRAHITFFGADASENQGLFNASSETVVLPADSGNNTELSSYIPSELFDFLVSQVREVSNLSYNMLKPIVIVAPINAINYLKSKLIPVSSYIKDSSSLTIAQVFENVIYDMNGMNVEFVPCSYMAGKGSGNKDVMLIVAPGVEAEAEDRDSTAYFNSFSSDDFVNTFIDDALEYEEYQNPEINQAKEWVMTSIYTPAYTVRADAIRSIEYEY